MPSKKEEGGGRYKMSLRCALECVGAGDCYRGGATLCKWPSLHMSGPSGIMSMANPCFFVCFVFVLHPIRPHHHHHYHLSPVLLK